MKNIIRLSALTILLSMVVQHVFAKDWSIDVTVASDGSGDYTTISDAIAGNPNDGSNYVIFIKKGTYNEKLFITQNNITLLGEDRYETIITQAILRRIFVDENGTDWGVATINIQNGVTDLTLANLTVQNNFADLNPDVPENNDHTMAIRGGGDRIIIINCNIIATGGDTLSLWNTDGGRFYHSGCYFEGYVDYVCPRGYCYISNSDFFGYNKNASIWHDGSGGKDHKLVVKNSYFDGVEFGLGRFHRMSAFYLLDCDFSSELRNNGGINYVGDSTVQDRDKLIYGKRVYFDRCSRETGNYEWHENNLETAEGAPDRDDITDTWTFNDTWMPEQSIYNLLECAFLPHPGYRAKEVVPQPVLSWLPGKNASSHLVFFGDISNPEFIAEVSDTTFAITTDLGSASKYYWRVDEITEEGDTIRGETWNFSTMVSAKPAPASNPHPPIDDDYQINTVHLIWEANMQEVDSFYIYFGSADQLDLIAKQKNADLYLFDLIADSVYYWRVDTKNEFGVTEGPLWYFNYRVKDTSSLPAGTGNLRFANIYPNPALESVTIDLSTMQDEKIIISFYDPGGKKIYQQDLGSSDSGKTSHTLVFSEMDNECRFKGLYYLNINSGDLQGTIPLLIY